MAPEIVKAIVHGRHPLDLTARRLANDSRLAIAWNDQCALLAGD